METIIIPFRAVKAESLDQFKTEYGKARMRQPYWINISENTKKWIGKFDFIGPHTKRDILESQIARGLVWVEEKYGEGVKCESGDGG